MEAFILIQLIKPFDYLCELPCGPLFDTAFLLYQYIYHISTVISTTTTHINQTNKPPPHPTTLQPTPPLGPLNFIESQQMVFPWNPWHLWSQKVPGAIAD